MAKHSANILEWARRGAEARWQQLQAEMASLIETFPHLGSGTKTGRGRRPENISLREPGDDVVVAKARGRRGRPATAETPARKRSKMTAAQKRAVSLRMKKYWADRRKAAAKT
jgi:hypothetical protein